MPGWIDLEVTCTPGTHPGGGLEIIASMKKEILFLTQMGMIFITILGAMMVLIMMKMET